MTFIPCSQLTPAEWIATSEDHWWRVVTLGPPGFGAYARLRFIPDPACVGQSENEVAGQIDLPSDTDQHRLAVSTLLRHTNPNAEGYVLLWDGWGEDAFPEAVMRTPRRAIPNREYYLCQLPLADFVSGATDKAWLEETNRPMPIPSFIWPSDHSWCISKDVDAHWAGVGGQEELIEQLMGVPSLDVVPVEAHQKLPFYS